ncbi:uncharacterized protein LOC122517133 [Polistes fuscatus]|uniref:uncharacterized protein LOC122517133 n=1 Tax=Polistes fuscatus TaxID=30207 RepID=UPI001CA8202A|nr:uncharacterized protein LOC122517133 [Polistes fuscatus]
MLEAKMTIVLVCALLISQHVGAVVNKALSQASSNENVEDKKNEIKASERISNSYGPPADDYGPPIVSVNGGFNGPAPVYGPPLNIKPHYGPPKQTFGPPKLHFASLKQHFGPPLLSFPSFRPPKPQYGPPLKLNTPPLAGFPQASSLPNHLGPVKPGHGSPIPVSIESYRPRPEPLPLPVNPEYGPPPPLPPPQLPIQYELSSVNIHGPPPPPPAGVPAPPTPPDIMYDGWQPIAGVANQKQQGSTLKHYSSSDSQHLKYVEDTTNPNVPSDSYGIPITNPEAQHLKTSVRESSGDKNGLPPPALPVYDGDHSTNVHGSSSSSSSFHSDHHERGHHQSNLKYNIGNSNSLSIVKTVGFELLPNTESQTSDLQNLSHESNSGVSSYEHSSGSLNVDAGLNSGLSVLPLQELDQSSHDVSLGNEESHGVHNVNDITLQQLPELPSVNFGKANGIAGGSILPPPADSYAAPPISSYSPDGPYPAAQSGRTGPTFPPFGPFGASFQKHGSHHHRFHGHFRLHGPPSSPPGSLIPPRNREPIKFREPIPIGLISNLHRYLPSLPPIDLTKPLKLHGPHLSFGPQLPSLNAPLSFHQSSQSDHSLSNVFSNSGSFGKFNSHILNSPMAAPNAQYGTPLSFTDFNTPAPVPTYGAPNFGPASTFGFTSNGFGTNLYDGIGNDLSSIYGTPVIANPPLAVTTGDCNYRQFNSVSNFEFDKGTDHLLPPSAPPALPSSTGEEDNSLLKSPPALPPLSDSLSPYIAPPVNTLDLEIYEQQKVGLKDSYGNPIGVSYESSNQAIDSHGQSNDHVHSSTTGVKNIVSLSSSSPSQSSFSSGLPLHQHGASAEALTASLTAQSYGEAKSLSSNDVDASQYLKTDEGSQALALAQGLTADGPSGFQIQGSKGTYTLQIQPADGGLGTENSDGSIRHDQVLSNGLLQDIIAAIEQPDQSRIELQGPPQAQPLEEFRNDHLSEPNSLSHQNGHYITIQSKDNEEINQLIREANKRSGQTSNNDQENSSKNEAVALFFNNQYVENTRKETRSVNKAEKQGDASMSTKNQKSDSKMKFS